ncbi:hypothetical protein [Halomarina oriensis]|uniref:Uncharacterized protein n=1 Tax=Halomarina oriensis TaxID=671145 RepID=A0A6B0GRZ4_9EURY|nr:hypothetical protein [Halomarina oriensis]MWG34845.1 hypothetical protein [Halomarina oriensis]
MKLLEAEAGDRVFATGVVEPGVDDPTALVDARRLREALTEYIERTDKTTVRVTPMTMPDGESIGLALRTLENTRVGTVLAPRVIDEDATDVQEEAGQESDGLAAPTPPTVDSGRPAIVEATGGVDVPNRPSESEDEHREDGVDFSALTNGEKREWLADLLIEQAPVESERASAITAGTNFNSRAAGHYLGQLAEDDRDDLFVDVERHGNGPATYTVATEPFARIDDSDDVQEDGDDTDEASTDERSGEDAEDQPDEAEENVGRSPDLPDGLTDGDVHEVAKFYETLEDVAADFDVEQGRAYRILDHYDLTDSVRHGDVLDLDEYGSTVGVDSIIDTFDGADTLYDVQQGLRINRQNASKLAKDLGIREKVKKGPTVEREDIETALSRVVVIKEGKHV